MKRCLERAAELIAAGEVVSLVTVAHVRGSAPREIGASMLVTRNETVGTIGGGQLEHQCTRIAAELLRGNDEKRGGVYRRFPLGANCGQCCGGVVDILFDTLTVETPWVRQLLDARAGDSNALLMRWRDENGGVQRCVIDGPGEAAAMSSPFSADVSVSEAMRLAALDGRARRAVAADDRQVLVQSLRSSDFTIAVFGAGHVGTATVAVLATLDTNIRWIDSRAALLPAHAPLNVQTLHSSDPAREVAALPENAWYLVMTHSHPLDYDICSAILRRGDFAYAGLIGSKVKRRRFEKRFRQDSVAGVDRLSCPIGVDGVSGKQPAEIAVAVAADLLQRRDAQRAGTGITRLRPVRRQAR